MEGAWKRRVGRVRTGWGETMALPSGEEAIEDVAHTVIEDPAAAIEIQPGAVVSKVLHRGDGLDVTIFGFDAGEGLTEHTATRPAIVQVLDGRLRVTVDGEPYEGGPGWWLHMAAGAPHALEAVEPTVMLLTMLP